MNERHVAGRSVLMVLLIIPIMGISVYSYYFLYGRKAMVIDVYNAKEFLWRARANDDLEVMAGYFQRSLEELGSRKGNPVWLNPTVDTDFDLIKSDIQNNINIMRQIARTSSASDYGYQRTVNNMQEITVELNDHLDIAVSWLTDALPFNVALNLVCWVVYLALWLFVIKRNWSRIRTFQRTHQALKLVR